MTLRDETWHADVQGLVRSLRGEPVVPTRHRRRLVAGVAALAVAALAGVGWWWSTTSGEDDEDAVADEEGEGAPPVCVPATGEDWTPIVLNDHATVEVADETEEVLRHRPLRPSLQGQMSRENSARPPGRDLEQLGAQVDAEPVTVVDHWRCDIAARSGALWRVQPLANWRYGFELVDAFPALARPTGRRCALGAASSRRAATRTDPTRPSARRRWSEVDPSVRRPQ